MICTNPWRLSHKSLEDGYLPNYYCILGKGKRRACGWDFLRPALVFTSCALTLGFLCLCHLSSCVRVPYFSVCDIKGQGLEGSSWQDKPRFGSR